MPAEILLGVLALAVAILVTVDLTRTKSESPHEHGDGLAHHATPTMIGATRSGPNEASTREPVDAAVAAVSNDASPPRQSERISPSVGGHQHSGAGPSAVPKRSHHRLTNWHVSSRLSLLVIVPAVAVTVIAFCVAGLSDVLNGARIHSPSSSARAGAILSALAIGILLGVVLVLAVWLTVVVAKSVLRPLYRLRARALAAASGLPDAARRIGEAGGTDVPSDLEPVDVDSPDEIGDVARAFQRMRGEMLRMAANEVTLHGKLDTMFVNLSHRSQSLVERQIRLIERLEQSEQDRERRASLSRMNRIAIHMYRNSQNLLILAGHDVSNGWNQPMALTNLIRAALAEIEEYERVALHAQPDIVVTGAVVNDVVHMLAELTQNATSFSAADMAVEISGQLLNSGGVVINITDRGVGMSTKDMAYANWRLENPSMTDIDVPKWTGLVVVARLASRHGIRVRLQQAEFGGLTALVWLPDDLLTSQEAAVPPVFSDLGSAGPRHGSHEAAAGLGRTAAGRSAAKARPVESAPSWEGSRNAPFNRRLIAEAGRRPGPAWTTDGARSVSETDLAATAIPSGSGLPDVMGEHSSVSSQVPALSGAAAGDVASVGFRQDRLSNSSVSGGKQISQPASIPLATDSPMGHKASSAEASVILPPAEDGAEKRRLPIYDAVESQWFRTGAGSDVHTSPDVTGAESRWSSPADEGWHAADTVESPSSGAATSAGLPKRTPKANLIPGAIPGTQPVTAVPNRSAAAARERLAGLQRGVSKGRAAASEGANPAGEDE